MPNQLRDYQIKGIDEVARKYASGVQSICFQLATGSGKTVVFSGLINRYLSKHDRRVLILVHREELMNQARQTLYDWYELIADPIARKPSDSQIQICMVETANNRLKKNPNFFGDVGVLILDEAHLGHFLKVLDYFPTALRLGFTATPISSDKKNPLKNIYQDIITGIDIPELIRIGSLVPNRTYHVKNVDRSSFSVVRGEFDQDEVDRAYSRPKQVNNTIKGYEDHALGQKTIIFNCNVKHSKLVTDAFVSKGYNCKHLDGTSVDRTEILKWFKETDDAILCNVAVATTGFDEKSIRCVIMNKAVLSLPLWLQSTGRGSRPFPGKDFFTILDLGGNALYHGDWCSPRDWEDIFRNPDKPRSKAGVAPIKECKQCEAIIAAGAKICQYCGADNSVEMKIDTDIAEFELLTSEKPWNLDPATIEVPEGANPYRGVHSIISSMIGMSRYHWRVKTMTAPIAYRMLSMFQEKMQEWCKANGKNYDNFHKRVPAEWLFKEIKKQYGWEPETVSLEV